MVYERSTFKRKPNIDLEKPNIETKINNIKCSTSVRKQLLSIYFLLNSTVFWRSEIIKVTNAGPTQATSYINILKEQHLIEAVSGQGKGKYKFK